MEWFGFVGILWINHDQYASSMVKPCQIMSNLDFLAAGDRKNWMKGPIGSVCATEAAGGAGLVPLPPPPPPPNAHGVPQLLFVVRG